MGTLGHYLRGARESLGVDLRDAAQQTRISHNYLQALENEDFSKLPGEVFVKGFLKNYGRFLRLDESEVLKKYEELRIPRPAPVIAAEKEQAALVIEPKTETKTTQGTPIEPFIWAAGIVILLGVFFFTALPKRHARDVPNTAVPPPEGHLEPAPILASKPEKLYLEVVALENTWLLVRTDNSPQKKAILKQGESLIWSADERFLLSYGSAGAIKILLNGQELTVKEPKDAVVRDLTITATGIVNRKSESEYRKPARPKQQPGLQQGQLAGQPTSTARMPEAPPLEKKTAPAPALPPPLSPPLPWQEQ